MEQRCNVCVGLQHTFCSCRCSLVSSCCKPLHPQPFPVSIVRFLLCALSSYDVRLIAYSVLFAQLNNASREKPKKVLSYCVASSSTLSSTLHFRQFASFKNEALACSLFFLSHSVYLLPTSACPVLFLISS